MEFSYKTREEVAELSKTNKVIINNESLNKDGIRIYEITIEAK